MNAPVTALMALIGCEWGKEGGAWAILPRHWPDTVTSRPSDSRDFEKPPLIGSGH